jgi:hypothetical protein
MGYLLRTVPFAQLDPFVESFDASIEDTFRSLSALPPEVHTAQVRAPFSSGGLSLRKLGPIAPGANLASLLLCLPIFIELFPELKACISELQALRLEDDASTATSNVIKWLGILHGRKLHLMQWVVQAWLKLHNEGLRSSLPGHPALLFLGYYDRLAESFGCKRGFKIQRHITRELDTRVSKMLLDLVAPDPALAARTLSNQNSVASAWVRVIPMKKALRLSPVEFRQGVRIYCGQGPSGLPDGYRCKCGSDDLSLSHILSCRNLRNRFARHDAIVDDIFQWLRRRKIQVRKEVLGLATGNHRIDLWVRNDGVTYWGDVTIADPARPSYLPNSAEQAGVAVSRAETGKISKWKKLAPSGVTVQPLALETTGRVGQELSTFLETMERGSGGGPSRSSLFVQLSVTCIRFNVECVRESVESGRGL